MLGSMRRISGGVLVVAAVAATATTWPPPTFFEHLRRACAEKSFAQGNQRHQALCQKLRDHDKNGTPWSKQ